LPDCLADHAAPPSVIELFARWVRQADATESGRIEILTRSEPNPTTGRPYAHATVDEAIRWLEAVRDPRKPFFLFVCFHEPHEPIATDPKYTGLYPSDDPSYSAHHGNITQMDDAFGRLMRALDQRGLRERVRDSALRDGFFARTVIGF